MVRYKVECQNCGFKEWIYTLGTASYLYSFGCKKCKKIIHLKRNEFEYIKNEKGVPVDIKFNCDSCNQEKDKLIDYKKELEEYSKLCRKINEEKRSKLEKEVKWPKLKFTCPNCGEKELLPKPIVDKIN